jgi:uncharacterized membrane protein (DUF106 family)
MKNAFLPMIIIMTLSILILGQWDQGIMLKNYINPILNPSFGFILNYNVFLGMTFIILMITFITTLIQKYTTNQEELKKIREEQKQIQEEMKKNKENPKKIEELTKKNMELMSKTFSINNKSLLITGIPLILLYRWFNDYFIMLNNPKFFGFLGWIGYYIIMSILFSIPLRKLLKVY